MKKPFNAADPFAVAVVKEDTTVGYVPRKISTICSFLRKNGKILCKAMGSRRYSEDLPQGGLTAPLTCHDVTISSPIQNFAVLVFAAADQRR